MEKPDPTLTGLVAQLERLIPLEFTDEELRAARIVLARIPLIRESLDEWVARLATEAAGCTD